MKLVVISDTHMRHREITLPEGDILVHAGDFEGSTLERIVDFNNWLGELPFEHKIVIAGNHDLMFEQMPIVKNSLTNCIYLEDKEVVIDGIKFYGSPWQPWFFDWAFNLPRKGSALRHKWWLIPDDTDVLITHGPPYGLLDACEDYNDPTKMVHVGCEILAEEVKDRIKPQVHIFGHIHEGYGQRQVGDIRYINASTCTRHYKPENPPIVFELKVPHPQNVPEDAAANPQGESNEPI